MKNAKAKCIGCYTHPGTLPAAAASNYHQSDILHALAKVPVGKLYSEKNKKGFYPTVYPNGVDDIKTPIVVVPYSTKKPGWVTGKTWIFINGFPSLLKPPVAKPCKFVQGGCLCEGALDGHDTGQGLPLLKGLPKKKKAPVKPKAPKKHSFNHSLYLLKVAQLEQAQKKATAKKKNQLPATFEKVEEIAKKIEAPRFDDVDQMRRLLTKYRTFRIDHAINLSFKPRKATLLGLWAYEQGAKTNKDVIRLSTNFFGLEYTLGFEAGFSKRRLPCDFRKISAAAQTYADSEEFRCGVEDAQLAVEVIVARQKKLKISEDFTI